jgi:Sec7-like guanine-nucleotide exchange factor
MSAKTLLNFELLVDPKDTDSVATAVKALGLAKEVKPFGPIKRIDAVDLYKFMVENLSHVNALSIFLGYLVGKSVNIEIKWKGDSYLISTLDKAIKFLQGIKGDLTK